MAITLPCLFPYSAPSWGEELLIPLAKDRSSTYPARHFHEEFGLQTNVRSTVRNTVRMHRKAISKYMFTTYIYIDQYIYIY